MRPGGELALVYRAQFADPRLRESPGIDPQKQHFWKGKGCKFGEKLHGVITRRQVVFKGNLQCTQRSFRKEAEARSRRTLRNNLSSYTVRRILKRVLP